MSFRKQSQVWGWSLAMLLCIATPVLGQTVNATVPQTLYHFNDDTEITVDVLLSGTDLVAGVDLVLSYPTDRFLGVPTWENGDLFGLVSANAEGTPGEVLVAAAAAEALGVAEGTLVTLTFQVPCEGNDIQGGVDLTFSFAEFLAWDETSLSLPADAPDATVTLECEPVAVDALSFGMIKAFFGASDGR